MKHTQWIGIGKGGYYIEHPDTKEMIPIYEFEMKKEPTTVVQLMEKLRDKILKRFQYFRGEK